MISIKLPIFAALKNVALQNIDGIDTFINYVVIDLPQKDNHSLLYEHAKDIYNLRFRMTFSC